MEYFFSTKLSFRGCQSYYLIMLVISAGSFNLGNVIKRSSIFCGKGSSAAIVKELGIDNLHFT